MEVQDLKQDVNVDEILLIETTAVLKVYVSLHYILVSVSYEWKHRMWCVLLTRTKDRL